MFYGEGNRLAFADDSDVEPILSPARSNDLEGGGFSAEGKERDGLQGPNENTGQDSNPVRGIGEDNEDERLCRICFEGGDYGPQGPLFRPCHCAGSMAWVHMECLDKWRQTSSNPQSFYRCDQCHFNYRFGRAFTPYARFDKFQMVRMLESRLAKFLVSITILTGVIFLFGFPYKLVMDESWEEFFSIFNINHMIGGSIILGLGSLFTSTMTWIWGGHTPTGPHFLNFRRMEGSRELLAVLVVIGLLIALYWLYNRIEEYATRVTRMAAHIVLDVHAE